MPGGGARRKQPRLRPSPPLLPGPRKRCVRNRTEGWSDWGCGLEPEVSQACSWEASTGSKEAWGEEEAGLRSGNRSESLRGITHCTYAQKHTHVHTCLLRTGLIRGVAEGCLRQPGSGSEESARPEREPRLTILVLCPLFCVVPHQAQPPDTRLR